MSGYYYSKMALRGQINKKDSGYEWVLDDRYKEQTFTGVSGLHKGRVRIDQGNTDNYDDAAAALKAAYIAAES